MQKLNVLMLSSQYMPDVYGGAEKQCMRLAQQLLERGVGVRLLTSTQTRALPPEETCKVTRIYTGVAPDLLGRWMLFSIFWLLRSMFWAWRRRKEYDVIHCHQAKYGAFVGCVIGRLTGKPVLIKVGNSGQHMDLLCLQRKKIVGKFCARYVLNSNPLFVAITETIADNLRDFGCLRVVKIANGIDPMLLQQAGIPAEKEDGICHIFYHGRIELIKRVDVLVEAFGWVARVDGRIKLHIIGDGNGLVAATEKVQALGLAERVEFHGRVENPAGLIGSFNLFVNASEAEGMSNSLLEALLLQKVLVSTPVSGASDVIVNGENGYIASGQTALELAQALIAGVALYRSKAESVQALSTELISKRYSISVVSGLYLELYEKLHRGLV